MFSKIAENWLLSYKDAVKAVALKLLGLKVKENQFYEEINKLKQIHPQCI